MMLHWRKQIFPLHVRFSFRNFLFRGENLWLCPSLNTESSFGLSLCIPFTCCLSLCRFICVTVLLCMEDTVPLGFLFLLMALFIGARGLCTRHNMLVEVRGWYHTSSLVALQLVVWGGASLLKPVEPTSLATVATQDALGMPCLFCPHTTSNRGRPSHLPGIYMGVRDQNSGLHRSTESSLPTESSPQMPMSIYIRILINHHEEKLPFLAVYSYQCRTTSCSNSTKSPRRMLSNRTS